MLTTIKDCSKLADKDGKAGAVIPEISTATDSTNRM